MISPYQVTRDFEAALCEYTGAKYAVAVNSCTTALLLVCEWIIPGSGVRHIEIPARTYVSVPQAILRGSNNSVSIIYTYADWCGAYQLKPLPVWDCARRFTSGMYVPGQFQCVSFAASKILGAEQGGAILHDHDGADQWFRKMRFDGRTEDVDTLEDTFDLIGHHCLMIPSVAATLLVRLYHLPKHNEDMPQIEYPDLSKFECFK